MFEFALYKDVEDNFTSTLFSGGNIPIYLGDAPETAQQPYIVMWVLDSNGTPQQLCDSYDDSGNSFIQFNVFTETGSDGLQLKKELDLYVSGLRTLTIGSNSYIIDLKTHQPSQSLTAFNNGLGVDVLAKTFNYKRG